jgi:hypothetical protein
MATLASSARTDGSGGYTFSVDGQRRRRQPDAHRIEPRISDLGR